MSSDTLQISSNIAGQISWLENGLKVIENWDQRELIVIDISDKVVYRNSIVSKEGFFDVLNWNPIFLNY